MSGANDGPISAAVGETFAGCRIHHARTIRALRRDRAQKRIRTRCVRSARPQFLSCGRFPSACPPMMDSDRIAEIQSKTAVVIPAYHEEKHIGEVVLRTRAHL